MLFFFMALVTGGLLSIGKTAQAQVTASFSADNTAGCGQLSAQFTDESTGNPSSWQWDFGNGNTSTLQNPNAAFTKPGDYTVKLTVSNGVSVSTAEQTIHVYAPPTVSFSLDPATGCYPLSVQFTDNSTGGSGTITSRTWDFGDGTPFSEDQNPTHVYDSAGTFVVKLSVTNSAGCTSSSSNQKVVTNHGVTVDFTADKPFSCAAPQAVQLTATTSSNQAIQYAWDFGDGGTASGKTATHTYNQKGTYSVSLTASVGNGGCRDTVVKKNYINVGNNTSDFTVPQGCANVPLSFKNTSVPLPASAVWTFSDGTTVNGIDAKHQFGAAGTYTVTLTNHYGGCSQTITKSITTYPSPKADFQSDKQIYCGKPAAVVFENLSQGADSWKWRFGDLDSTAEQAPTHNYKAAGNYNVTLYATNANGCVDSVTKAAYIHVDAPDIHFGASPGFGCVGLTSAFTIPAASKGEITSYQWDFGDGGTSTAADPTHQFNTAGAFTVGLQVVTDQGCNFTFSRKDYIHTGAKPVVDFSAIPLEACLGTAVQFTNLSKPEGSIWVWNFPDDGNTADSIENPKHQFSHLGPQDVMLTVSNNGCKNSLTKPGYITVKPPSAGFHASVPTCTDPYTIHFTDQSSSGVNSWVWDFGDGSTSTEQNPSHTYTTTGAKKVILRVSNGDCQDTALQWVRIVDEKPALTVPAGAVCHGAKVTLSAANIAFPAFVSSLTYSSGDGNTFVTKPVKDSVPPAEFRYGTNGTYTPSLTLKDVNGCSHTVTGDPVTVQGPTAAFNTSTGEICQGSQVTFTDQSKLDPTTAPLRQWVWDFGDTHLDTTTTGSVIHTYLENGTFTTQLKVTDANGCTDNASLTTTSEVNVLPSKASFSSPDTMICPGAIVHWDNTSEGGTGAGFLWKFGDGTTSTLADPPAKTYSRDSTYTVSLIMTTPKGCMDSVTKTNYILVGSPHAIMNDSLDVKICSILKDTAISLSKNYSSILWDFGDGGTAINDTVYHIYNIPGTYTQKLKVNGFSAGCMDSASRKITITGPVGDALIDDTAGCQPHQVHFSARNVTTAVKYQWDFGNGAYSPPATTDKATYTYDHAGVFHPKLLLTDAKKCTVIIPINDTLTVVVDSIGLQATHSWPEVCDSGKIQFGARGMVFSEAQLGEPATYLWDFGDPATVQDVSGKPKPVYRYANPGTYYPSLTIHTKFGCAQTILDTVTVPDSVALQVTATADPTAICQGSTIQLQANGNIAESYNWSPATGLSATDQAHVTAAPSASTTYVVTASTKNKCQTDTARVNVVVHSIPKVDAGPDQTVATGSVVQLQATGSTDVVGWKWTPTDYLSCTHCEAPTSTPRQPITYQVTGTNGFGCSDSASVKINLVCDEGKVFIPNTFTPNEDGTNDLFYPRGRGVKTILYFRVFDRFGQLIYERTNFQLNDKKGGWDGTFKGHRLDPAVFVYSTEMVCDNNKIFKLSGNVTLLR